MVNANRGVLRERTCIGCRRVLDKRSMLRLAKSKDGSVSIDSSGNMPGRGAYVCSPDCLMQAIDRNSIGRSLRTRFANKFDDGEKRAIETFFSKARGCKE